MTSIPTRGMKTKPQPLPAQGCWTRTQQELWSSRRPSRSQWNSTFTRPCSSVWISSPGGPTTTAVWTLWIRGLWPIARGR